MKLMKLFFKEAYINSKNIGSRFWINATAQGNDTWLFDLSLVYTFIDNNGTRDYTFKLGSHELHCIKNWGMATHTDGAADIEF